MTLPLAFLRRREELWTRSWLQQEVERPPRGKPAERPALPFSMFSKKWFRPGATFEGCSFHQGAGSSTTTGGHPVSKGPRRPTSGRIRAFPETSWLRDAGVRRRRRIRNGNCKW